MLSRVRSIDNVLTAGLFLALLGGAWWIWQAKRASEIAELRQYLPPAFADARLLTYCNESDFYAIDRRAIFATASSSSGHAPPLGSEVGKRNWIVGAIPASDFYNETSTFICPNIPQHIKQRILLSTINNNSLRHYGTHSFFWFQEEGLLVVRYYNN